MYYAKNTWISYSIKSHFNVCKPAYFSGYSYPQSFTQRILHMSKRVEVQGVMI